MEEFVATLHYSFTTEHTHLYTLNAIITRYHECLSTLKIVQTEIVTIDVDVLGPASCASSFLSELC